MTDTLQEPAEAADGPETKDDLGLPRIPKGARLSGERAETFARQVERAYTTRRAPIRLICEKTGRSYGAIHKILRSRDVTMRPKGYQRSTEPSVAQQEAPR